MPDWIIWVIVALVVLALIAALVVAANKKKKERNRTHAERIRHEAAAASTGIQQREAEARETEARAAQARAEADRKQAEADKLQSEAVERQRTAESHREEHHENLRRADELDPDVNTKSKEYDGPGTTPVAGGGTNGQYADRSGSEDDSLGQRSEERLGDRSANEGWDESRSGGSSDGTRVTHPDDRTETVTDSQDVRDQDGPGGGSHRA
jgi:hypothetical protein